MLGSIKQDLVLHMISYHMAPVSNNVHVVLKRTMLLTAIPTVVFVAELWETTKIYVNAVGLHLCR